MEQTDLIEDKFLACRDCRNTFVFSAAEQEFFKQKGLSNEPKRCPNCRLLLRSQRPGSKFQQTAEVACSGCQRMTRVPFLPNGCKPVLCNTCFYSKKDSVEISNISMSDEQIVANA